MKFQEAFDKIFDIEKEEVIKDNPGINVQFGIEPKTAKIMALVWNLLAVSGGKFDDLSRIDKNNNVVSIPLKAEKTKKEKDTDKSSANEIITAEGDNDSGSADA